MITVKDFDNNKKALAGRGTEVNIDSVFIENSGNIGKLFYTDEKLHKIHSCSKMLVAMAIGIAIDNRIKVNGSLLSLETKVYPIIKDLVKISNKENVEKIKQWTVRNLLTHSTGYEGQMMSSKFIMEVDENKLLDYVLNYSIFYEVGERFAYNNAEPFILSVFFQEAFGINLTEFINQQIFKKIGISNYQWDNYGKYCPGATGLMLSHSDFHKLGQLLLNDGKYNGTQVVPSVWMEEMCSFQFESKSEYKPERLFPKLGTGYFMWISRDGFVFRDGSNNQYIILNKQKKLLITILASDKDAGSVTEILRGLV